MDEFISSAEFNPETSEKETPLLGVPFSCKESIFVKGKPSTAGMVNRKNLVADDDSDVVKNIKKSGGILLCLTNTAEVSYKCSLPHPNLIYGFNLRAAGGLNQTIKCMANHEIHTIYQGFK